MPRSSRIAFTFSPESFMRLRPSMNDCTALTGSFSHASANSCALMPVTLEMSSSASVAPSLKFATLFPMLVSVWDMAVPPASASIPTEDMEAARARISVDDNPAIVPADARRVAIAMILASSVAKLLPRSTIAEPSLSTSSRLSPVMFMNLARDVAASCALTLVVSPSIIIVLVNFSISSAPTPS